MPGRFIVDTNVIIDLFANKLEVNRLISNATEIFIPYVVLGELYFGVYKSRRAKENVRRIDNLRSRMTILGADSNTAQVYGKMKALLAKKGKPLPENDIWIGALAMQHDLTLLTRDKHFREIDDIAVKFTAQEL